MTKRKINCSVVNCENNSRNSPQLMFYRFPTSNHLYPHKAERRSIWLTAVRREGLDKSPWNPRENDRICSAHFVNNIKSEDPRSPSYNPTIFPVAGSASNTRKESLKESHRKASSSRQGSDKEENLSLLSLLTDCKREEEPCSELPEEISESGAEVLSSESDPFDIEFAQIPKTACFSPSNSAEIYNTGVPSCVSPSDNWSRRNETEVETSPMSNPPLLHGVINDACSKFFQSMADTVRDLPPDLQIVVKRNVLHAVTECELTALNRLNVSNN